MIAAALNHIWQSTLFGIVVWVIVVAFRNSSASVRFRLWLAASVKFLVPFAILTAAGERLTHLWRPPFDAGPELLMIGKAAQPFPELAPAQLVSSAVQAPVFNPALWLLGLWATGSLVIMGVWLLRWLKLQSILRSSRPLPWIAPIPIRVSSSMLEPGLVGIRRPVLLLPASLPEHLAQAEVDAILAHEFCHFRRRDNLAAALHMLVEALFWFHPMTRWIGGRLVAERERACDDAVVQSGHDREVYARAILESCRLYLRSPLPCVSGASGSNLEKRVEDIMTAPAPRPVTAQQMSVLLMAGVIAFATPLLAGVLASPAVSTAHNAPAVAPVVSEPTPEQAARNLAEQQQPRKLAPFDPARFDRYVGYYALRPDAVLTITRDGDRFLAQMTGQQATRIYPESDTKFFLTTSAAQLQFVNDAGGRTVALVLHQSGVELRGSRVGAATAAGVQRALDQRIAANKPSPGTTAFVLRWLASEVAGKPDYSEMTPALANASRDQWPQTSKAFRTFGALKGVRFMGVSPQGFDTYEAEFEHNRVLTTVSPLVDGKVHQHRWRPLS